MHVVKLSVAFYNEASFFSINDGFSRDHARNRLQFFMCPVSALICLPLQLANDLFEEATEVHLLNEIFFSVP